MELISMEQRGDVVLLGLNRPEKRNAISDRVIEALDAAITEAEKTAKAGVIFGHGKHFSAGLDLAEHVHKTPMEGVYGSRRWHQVFDRLYRGKMPWVAA